LRQLLIAGSVGGALGFGRGLLWPGYHEKLDPQGNVTVKKKRNPWLGAVQGAALGTGTSALSNYASQTMAQYNPEIDQFLSGLKQTATGLLPLSVTKKHDGVDVNKQFLDRVTTTA
jgi:hypothetical protein